MNNLPEKQLLFYGGQYDNNINNAKVYGWILKPS